jgi:GNAT superfamily N-acetyltransferase
MNEIVVRPYRERDRQAVRRIAWETAFMGKPADAFFSDRKLFEDFLTIYFTDYEPESCFVADDAGSVVGYLIGAKDEHRIASVMMARVVPRLFLRLLVRDSFLLKQINFIFRVIVSSIRGEFKGEDFYRDYPAVLHVNLNEDSRGKGAGKRLIAAYIDYLKQASVCGVHLATMSPDAGAFFEKQGFVLLARYTRSYFRHITGSDSEVMIYGLTLKEAV